MQIGSNLHTRQSYTQSDKYQVSHRYSYFSWWWAHSCPKHVEKRNKHTKKNFAPSWLYLQDWNAVPLTVFSEAPSTCFGDVTDSYNLAILHLIISIIWNKHLKNARLLYAKSI